MINDLGSLSGTTTITTKLTYKNHNIYHFSCTGGKLLPGNKQKCLGVNNKGKLANINCSVDKLSVEWIWTIDEQMLNLKALKCLRGDIIVKINKKGKLKTTKEFSLERCNIKSQEQKWACTQPGSQEVKNQGSPNFTSKWINGRHASYFKNCAQHIFSYKGNAMIKFFKSQLCWLVIGSIKKLLDVDWL